APLRLAAVERRPVADGDEDVLQRRPARVVRMCVAGGDGLDAEALGELAEQLAPPPVATLVRTLELDEEAVAPECACQPSGRIRIADRETVTRAAGEADQSVVQLLQACLVERRLSRRLALPSGRSRVRVRRGDQPAEVGVSRRR